MQLCLSCPYNIGHYSSLFAMLFDLVSFLEIDFLYRITLSPSSCVLDSLGHIRSSEGNVFWCFSTFSLAQPLLELVFLTDFSW